jgi:hypothetical protein
MKKIFSILLLSAVSAITLGQVSKSMKVDIPGSLNSLFTMEEKSSITTLSLTGEIDARDFVTMRDKMPNLTELNLSEVRINAYSGEDGTATETIYSANSIPKFAFMWNNTLSYGTPTSIVSIILPLSILSIDESAFMGCNKLKSITIPSSVNLIGGLAFQGCTSLTDIELPKALSSINELMFDGCKGLTTVKIPEQVTKIGKSSFAGCDRLSSILLPPSLTRIESSSFKGCSELSSIKIPNSVVQIDELAFAECANLKTVVLPSSLISIGTDLFYNCNNLVTIEIDKSNQNFMTEDGILYDKTKTKIITFPTSKHGNYKLPTTIKSIGNALFYGSSIDSIVIPASVKSIGSYSFCECKSLSTVTIESSVYSIGSGAFESCTNLRTINLYSKVPTRLSTGVFAKINKSLVVLKVPKGTKGAYQLAIGWKEFKNIVELNF